MVFISSYCAALNLSQSPFKYPELSKGLNHVVKIQPQQWGKKNISLELNHHLAQNGQRLHIWANCERHAGEGTSNFIGKSQAYSIHVNQITLCTH